jgi:hypothetical protein
LQSGFIVLTQRGHRVVRQPRAAEVARRGLDQVVYTAEVIE